MQTLPFPKGYYPHWIGADRSGSRIALSGFGALAMKIVMLDFDQSNGTLSIDETFGEADAQGIVGLNTNRMQWPHGSTGPAIPHSLVFSN